MLGVFSGPGGGVPIPGVTKTKNAQNTQNQPPGCFPGVPWCIRGGFVVVPWWFRDGSLMVSWWFRDGEADSYPEETLVSAHRLWHRYRVRPLGGWA